MKTSRPVKFCHFTLLNATDKEVKRFTEAIRPIRDKITENLDYDIEFLITNNSVKLTDLKPLIDHLTLLYDKYKAIRKDKLDKMYTPSPEEPEK